MKRVAVSILGVAMLTALGRPGWPAPATPQDQTVYVTSTGKVYHTARCRLISGRWTIPMKLKEAVDEGYSPCTVCNPPKLSDATESKTGEQATEPQATEPKAQPKSEGVQPRMFEDRPGLSDVPHSPGLYYFDEKQFARLEGQPVSFARTGSLLSSAVTVGIKSRKINVQIMGATAGKVVSIVPVFLYRVASGNEAAGGSGSDLVLVHMTVKHGRRQFEIGAEGFGRMSTGISLRSQVSTSRKQIEPDLYRIIPAHDLKGGQYGLYLFRGYNLPALIYDFGVE